MAATAGAPASDQSTIIVIEEKDDLREGTVQFQAVDLKAMKLGTVKFKVNKNALLGSRLRTSSRNLQVKGEYALTANGLSRFSSNIGLAGDFGFVEYRWRTGNSNIASGCFMHGFPVYRFKAGGANLISAEMLPSREESLGQSLRDWVVNNSNGPSYTRDGRQNDLADAKAVLEENGKKVSELVRAEFLGFYAFKGKDGRFSSCKKAPDLVDARQLIAQQMAEKQKAAQ
jgi:hypothetical protein